MDTIDPSRCPACGRSNACGEQQAPGSPCWCFELVIEPGRIDALPADAKGRACLCRACASGSTPPEAR